MQYTDTPPLLVPVVAHGAPQAATVQCAICGVEMPDEQALMSERIDPDDHTWYTFFLCPGCADPADLLIDRLMREELARQAAR